MKLVFLADVEHMHLYGEPLSDLNWTWYNYGPFSPAVYGAVESLSEQGHIQDIPLNDGRRSVLPATNNDRAIERPLPPRTERALTRVLERFGSLPLPALKQAAYDTETMRASAPGQRLDLSHERQRTLVGAVPGLAALFARSPAPGGEEQGDPEASAAEDRAILDEFAKLRREANRDPR